MTPVPLLLVMLSLVLVSSASTNQCTYISASEAPACSKIVDYPILVRDGVSVSAREALARADARPGTEAAPKCGFYSSLEYQCRKHFPRCVETPNGPRERKMCTSTCQFGLRWRQRQCRYFTDDYFFAECGKTQFYSDQGTGDAPCDDVPVELLGEPRVIRWKEFTAAGMFLLALWLGGSSLLTYLKDRRLTNELNQALSVELSRFKAQSAADVLMDRAVASGILSSQQSRRNQALNEEFAKVQTERKTTTTIIEEAKATTQSDSVTRPSNVGNPTQTKAELTSTTTEAEDRSEAGTEDESQSSSIPPANTEPAEAVLTKRGGDK